MSEKTDNKILLIDGDIIAYSVGFAAEGEPLEHALHSVKKMIYSMLDAVKTDEYFVFLTGKGNYRDKVAVTKPYKGNRKTVKPEHWQDIRDYLVDVHEATVINGMEADDAMGIFQSKANTIHMGSTCIATIDKDLDMIPGWHYNWRREELYYIDDRAADLFFYKQLLMGDPTDNIPGLPGIGHKKADAILHNTIDDFHDNFHGEYDDFATEEEAIYWSVLEEYELRFDRPFEMMNEQAQLIWIRREKNEEWCPKW